MPMRRNGPAQLLADTIRSYLHALGTCEQYHRRRRIDRLGPDALRRYQAYLFEEKKLAVGTVGLHVAALRFFFVRVLKRRELKEDLPTPKRHRRLPTVLSPDEVRRLIAGAKNLYHRTGLRRSELLQLKVSDIDSRRMVVRVERGKGGHGREVPLSPTLLAALREYCLRHDRRRRPPDHPRLKSGVHKPRHERSAPTRRRPTHQRPAGSRRRSRAASLPIHAGLRAGILACGSIAGRRASGFLQVSLSKVSRHRHRAARPATRAETPPITLTTSHY
jgi:integrase